MGPILIYLDENGGSKAIISIAHLAVSHELIGVQIPIELHFSDRCTRSASGYKLQSIFLSVSDVYTPRSVNRKKFLSMSYNISAAFCNFEIFF